MRFVVAGAGAVGGYLGARLTRAGHDVTLIARGPHLAAIQERGVRVKSPEGDFDAHPAVAEAVAFGVPHPVWGEVVAAAVVLHEPVAEAELLAWCRDRLARFKCPDQLHVVEAIPRTATGKILKTALRATENPENAGVSPAV